MPESNEDRMVVLTVELSFMRKVVRLRGSIMSVRYEQRIFKGALVLSCRWTARLHNKRLGLGQSVRLCALMAWIWHRSLQKPVVLHAALVSL